MNTPTEEKLFSCAIRSALDADQLRERLNLALAACAEYRAELDKARADSRRLDWAFTHIGSRFFYDWIEFAEHDREPTRADMDEAMQQEAAP